MAANQRLTLVKFCGQGDGIFLERNEGVVSSERLQVTGGRLNIEDTIRVSNSFVLKGSGNETTGLPKIATLRGTVLRGAGGQGLEIAGNS